MVLKIIWWSLIGDESMNIISGWGLLVLFEVFTTIYNKYVQWQYTHYLHDRGGGLYYKKSEDLPVSDTGRVSLNVGPKRKWQDEENSLLAEVLSLRELGVGINHICNAVRFDDRSSSGI
jgi:hypothetical protein